MPNETNGIKKSVDLTFFAKLLISVAIALLVYGFYLDVQSDNKLIDPGTGIDNTSKKGETITTIDIHHWDDSVNEVEIEEEPIEPGKTTSPGKTGTTSGTKTSGTKTSSTKPSGGKTSGTGKTTSPSSSTKPSSSPSPSATISPSPSPSLSPSPTPSTPTIDQQNNVLRNNIQNTYGITVKYGSETSGYRVGGLSTNAITDPNVVNSTLNKLNGALSLYPNGFFREIKNGGIPLTVYLIDSYSEYGVTGVTDSNYSFANISVAVAYPFEVTFYHESYHYIERYIFKKGIYYSSWDSYNPSGFSYGSLWRDQSFSRTGAANAYFVNDYAQSSAEEDRASTFEYMMQASKPACLNRDQPIWKKASAMSNSIDAAINCVTPSTTEYWERHL